MSGLRKVIAMMLVCVFIGSIPCVSYASPTILTQTRQIGGGYYNTTSKINFTVTRRGRSSLDASFQNGVLPNVVAGYAGFKFVNSSGVEIGILIKTDFYEDVIETGTLNPISVSVSQLDTSGNAVSAKGHYNLICATWDLQF